MIRFPEKGKKHQEVLEKLASFRDEDANWKDGKTWSLVYNAGDAHTEFLKQAYGTYFHENALNPFAFKSLRKLEKEVLGFCSDLFHGDEQTVGTMTTGGTESLLMAIKTYRDKYRHDKKLKWERTRPNIIVPESIHVAVEKAGHYFDVEVRHAPLDKNYRVNVKAVEKMINSKTIALFGSAPNYPQGVVDPIEELSTLALKKKIPLHVDACVGGMFLPFLEELSASLGTTVPLFDFRLPGVTSISADLHKYGYAAKGASVLLYRSMNYLEHQFFIYENWPGGIFASPSMPGTKPGGSIAASWATLMHFGKEGMRENVKKVWQTTRELIQGIESIPELTLVTKPDMALVAYTTKKEWQKRINIYAVGDMMEKRGWHIDRQQRPECLHAMVTLAHQNVIENYIADLREAVKEVRENPELASKGNAAMYGMMADIPFRGLIKQSVLKFMKESYGSFEAKNPVLNSSEEAPKNLPQFLEKWAKEALDMKREIARKWEEMRDKN